MGTGKPKDTKHEYISGNALPATMEKVYTRARAKNTDDGMAHLTLFNRPRIPPKTLESGSVNISGVIQSNYLIIFFLCYSFSQGKNFKKNLAKTEN